MVKYYPHGTLTSYLGLSLLSATTVMALDTFKIKIATGKDVKITPGDNRPAEEVAISLLERIQECFDSSNDLGKCFFDYSYIKTDKAYDTLSQEWKTTIEQARKEIRTRKPATGIEKLMKMADSLGDFCLEQTESDYVRRNSESLSLIG